MPPVAVVAVTPMAVMSPVAMMMSASRPVLSVGTPLMFGPEDVVGPVSLRVSPTTLALVHLPVVVVVVIVVVMRALGMNHVMSIVGDDKDHLQPGQAGGRVAVRGVYKRMVDCALLPIKTGCSDLDMYWFIVDK